MTTPLSPSPAAAPREEDARVKAMWVRPTLDVVDIDARTRAGGAVSADQDPNQPS